MSDLWPVEIPRRSCGPGCDGKVPHDIHPDAYCAVGVDWDWHPKLSGCETWCRENVRMRRAAKMKQPEGYTYLCMEDFLLDRAQLWTPAALPRPVRMGPIKACFFNAHKLAKRHPRTYRYVEGLAYCGFFPMHHAWVVDAQGRVIDNTWRERGTEYFGCVFDLSVALPALDDWTHRHPVFKWPRLDTNV